MWTSYRVRLDFITQICGSVPADPELQKKWREARAPKRRPAGGKSLEEIAAELQETTPEDAEPTLHIFQRHEGGLVLRMATFRAHWKDCARVISQWWGKVEKEKSFAVKVLNAVYYPPNVYWVPILSAETGKQIGEPTGQRDKPVHAWTPQGPISALKTFEYVEGARVEFDIMVLTPPGTRAIVSKQDLENLFSYGGTHGYGGERGDGEGRYVATISDGVEA